MDIVNKYFLRISEHRKCVGKLLSIVLSIMHIILYFMWSRWKISYTLIQLERQYLRWRPIPVTLFINKFCYIYQWTITYYWNDCLKRLMIKDLQPNYLGFGFRAMETFGYLYNENLFSGVHYTLYFFHYLYT